MSEQPGESLTNREIARLLIHIADLMEISGEGPRRAGAYRRAAQSVDSFPEPVARVAREGRLQSIRGVGKTIASVLDEIVSTGTSQLLAELQEKVPAPVVEMLNIPGIGPRTLYTLVSQLGVKSIDELEEAARQGRIRTLPGFGPKREENILAEILGYRRRQARGRYVETEAMALQLVGALTQVEVVQKVAYAGSLRRRRATIGNIDLVAAVVTMDDAPLVLAALAQLPEVEQVISSTGDYAEVRLQSGMECRLRVTTETAYPVVLHYYTGSASHNQQLREWAKGLGFDLRWNGLFAAGDSTDTGVRIPVLDEHQLYETLNLPYIYPELRQGTGELEAARDNKLPDLVKLRDLKGDLHLHTEWSDGAQTIEQLHAAAAAKGYQYIAITDHSKSLAVARGLDEERLARQIETIYRLREQLPEPFLLTGSEVDILPDGTLDLDDNILARLDVVVASVHSRFAMNKAAMTRRIIRALENPQVDILGHPTGRILGYRDGYEVDLEKVLAAAAETGTVVEINASPERLDLPDRWVRRAGELGVLLAINTDAHTPEGLDFARYGVYVARRGWAEAWQIINTWPRQRLLEFLSLPKEERRTAVRSWAR